MIERIRRMALPIAYVSLIVNLLVLVVSIVLWGLAFACGWLDSVVFVSNVSMLALVFAGISGVAAGLAGVLALVPTDDIVDAVVNRYPIAALADAPNPDAAAAFVAFVLGEDGQRVLADAGFRAP